MNDIVVEFTERVKQDYQALPPPIRKKFKKNVFYLLAAGPHKVIDEFSRKR